MKEIVFVASPSAMGRMPVASGSNVPACPAFCAFSSQRRKLLDYLKRTDEARYKTLIERLNIRR